MGRDDNDEKNEEDKDLELDLMAEQELLRLTRQYRVGSKAVTSIYKLINYSFLTLQKYVWTLEYLSKLCKENKNFRICGAFFPQ